MSFSQISIFTIVLFIGIAVSAQNDSVLLSIDNEPIYVKEYERLFSKNADLISDHEEPNIDENLELFIDYLLKVKAAEDQGLDTLSTFTQQYENYRNQLATQHLFNTNISHQLVREAYDRLQYERNIDYILIQLKENASPQDTLKAFQKAMAFKKEVTDGRNFRELALQYSEDPSVKENQGNLGWINVFKTVYPFENAAYETEIGEISEPFRSQFGYHVIRVNDERKSSGQVSVAHILIKNKKEQNTQETKKKIKNIYQKIKDGADFSDIAKQYSEDRGSAKKGGQLKAFKAGDLRYKNFEEIAFNLNKENSLSKPFQTESGWHIIQWRGQSPIGSFEKEKKSLEQKIKRDRRSRIVRDSLVNELQQQYDIKTEGPGLAYFKENVGENFVEKSTENLPSGTILQMGESSLSYSLFLEKVKQYKNLQQKEITVSALDKIYEELKGNMLITHAKHNLDKINIAFANELKDYRNGMLIYDLLQKNVFEKSDDSVALKEFYLKNRKDFTSKKQYEVLTVSANRKKDALKARRFLKRGKSTKAIKEISSDILVHSGIFTANDSQLPQNFKKSPGVSAVIKQNGVYLTAKTIEVIPAKQLGFEKVKGLVLNKYQEKIEKDFIKQLREKYEINRNQKVVNKLKSRI